MNHVLKNKITAAITQVETASEEPNAFGFLPAIKESLDAMLSATTMTSVERERLAGSLGRLVTEDFAFSDSQMGTMLLELADEFASKRD